MSTDTRRAIVFMVASMAFFAVEDFFIKRVSTVLPIGQTLVLLSGGMLAVFACACLWRRFPLLSRDMAQPLVALRSVSEAGATICMVVAVAAIPLSLASAIFQMQPILITAGAALWLGERVGARRWIAVAVGLAGVLLIIQPGLAGFEPMAIFAVLTAISLAIRDLAARNIPARVENWQLGTWAFACVFIVSLAIFAVEGRWSPVPLVTGIELSLSVASFVGAYICIMIATRIGEVSAVIPFRYTRLVFALALGMIFLGERPDLLTWIGAAIVIGSGLYSWARERAAT